MAGEDTEIQTHNEALKEHIGESGTTQTYPDPLTTKPPGSKISDTNDNHSRNHDIDAATLGGHRPISTSLYDDDRIPKAGNNNDDTGTFSKPMKDGLHMPETPKKDDSTNIGETIKSSNPPEIPESGSVSNAVDHQLQYPPSRSNSEVRVINASPETSISTLPKTLTDAVSSGTDFRVVNPPITSNGDGSDEDGSPGAGKVLDWEERYGQR